MKKRIMISTIVIMLVLSGCSQSVTYSERFEGIPIYPGLELVRDSEYEEDYELLQFEGTFEEVEKFYIANMDQEKWEMKENPLYQHEDNSLLVSQGYLLKSRNQEISLIIERIKKKDKNNSLSPLHIHINGSPLKEGKYKAVGQSKNWETSLEYIIRKDRFLVNGEAVYTGDYPPKKVNRKFLLYEIKESSVLEDVQRQPLEDSKLSISSQSHREFELEDYKQAINNSYIEIDWQDQGREKTEKLDIKVVE